MALSNSSVDEPVHQYDLLRTIDAFLSIAICTTFYERDSLLLRKYVLLVVTRIEISIRTLSIPFVDYP
jgi:hypothetical protein